MDDLKREGLIRTFGISVNRWEPANVLRALRTGLVDAVQVVHNIFDQAPEDELFPACQELKVAVLSRVPFDEGSLTGQLTRRVDVAHGRLAQHLLHPREPGGDARARRGAAAPRAAGMDLPELALRYILEHPAVTTTIPGMRKARHVDRNLAASRRQAAAYRPRDRAPHAPLGSDDGDSVVGSGQPTANS